ncbi:MAG: nucleotidyltransferase family protein, partial [Tissierellales bacterium]
MKLKLDTILISIDCTIREVLEKLDIGAKGIVLVVDRDKKLIGTITDGDVRRALLKGYSIDDNIDSIIHKNPICVLQGTDRQKIKDIFIKKAVKQIPVVNENGMVVDLIGINDILIPEGKENPVVIMAGGLGTRLKDLTKEVPKPMLKVGQDPILYHIINNFKRYGYNRFLISVNYKAKIIENYFQDGYAYGVKISYIREKERLGTAGGIKLAEEYLSKPFFVINGDIFTNLNVDNMMKYHLDNQFDMTIAVRKYVYQIPYGVIETKDNVVKNIKEKPEKEYLINGGIYCLNPEIVKLIPDGRYYEITDLINTCIYKGLKVGYYEIKEYWMDIGKIE